MSEVTPTYDKAKITVQGLQLLTRIMLTGESMKLTRAAIGEGVPDGEPSALTELVSPIPSHKTGEEGTSATVDFQAFDATDDTTACMRVNIQNGDTAFTLREIGIYAQDPDGGEILYAYTCDRSKYAMPFPSNSGGANVSETVDIPFFVANTDTITIEADITLPAEVSLAEFTVHKSAAELDHPDGSVTNRKIADGAVTANKIGDGAVTLKKLAESVHEFHRKLTTDILNIFFALEVDVSIEHNFDYGQDECVIKNVNFMAIPALQNEVDIDYQKEKYTSPSVVGFAYVCLTRKEGSNNQLFVSVTDSNIPKNALAVAPVENGTIQLV